MGKAQVVSSIAPTSKQWPEESDFVARFCTLRESENTWTCEKCTRVTQIMYLGPLPIGTCQIQRLCWIPWKTAKTIPLHCFSPYICMIWHHRAWFWDHLGLGLCGLWWKTLLCSTVAQSVNHPKLPELLGIAFEAILPERKIMVNCTQSITLF